MGKHRLLTVYHIKRILDDHENKGLSLSPESQLVVLWAGFLHGLSEESCSSGDAHRKTSDAVQQILARFHKPPMFIRRVLFLLTRHNMLMHLIHEEDPGDENAVKPLIKGISSPEDLALAHVSALADLRAQAFPALYHFKESDLNCVTAICTRLGGFEDAHGIPMGFHPDPAPEILASCDDGPVRVDIIKQGAIRAVKARFESCSEPVLPALAALENSGLELYDLKVISEKNRGRHVLLRVKAPRDTLFEMKKWAGFLNLLKDCASRAVYPPQPTWGDPATETEMSRENPVTLHTRHCGSGLVLNIGYPGVVPIYPLVKALVSNGLSPFYLKKTCDRKTYRLVLHLSPAEGAAPDHNALKEVIHALFKP